MSESVIVRPGDKLIVRIPAGSSMDMARAVWEHADRVATGVEVCVLAADQILVVRPGEVAE